MSCWPIISLLETEKSAIDLIYGSDERNRLIRNCMRSRQACVWLRYWWEFILTYS